jgi:2-polyprenyl-6-hydroxyphenyl methylase / 3-demethylubiquinone-9 3-methyltransferase
VAGSIDVYGEMDWWNPRHSLLQNVAFKVDWFHARIGALEGVRVLDVGCGGGLVAEALARRGADVTGVDLSGAALATARAHAAAGGLSIRYEQGRAEALPFADGAFDAVVCADCLEHVDDLERVVAEVARVLRPGGAFCYDTFNRTWLSRVLVTWFMERRLRREYRSLNVADPGVLHEWRRFVKPAELAAAMTRHGLVPGALAGVRLVRFREVGFELAVGGGTQVAYLGHATRR